jgi:hypothetical protein
LLCEGIEACKHYKYQQIANDLHVVFESPERFGTANRATLVILRSSILKWIAVTGAIEIVPHRQGSVSYRILAGNASSRTSLAFSGKKRFAGCMDEQ